MLLYYRDVTTDNAYNVQHNPRAQEVLRNRLNGARWREFAPGVRGIPDPPPAAPVERLAPNPAAPVPLSP